MIRNPAKALLRAKVKESLKGMSQESRDRQSKAIFEKVLKLPEIASSKRVSIYLSLDTEVNTVPIVEELFKRNKQVFVPTYHKDVMEMVKLDSMEDYESLPLTKWKIKQPDLEGRDNALETGGLDLVLLPGVVFTKSGGRCGHGMGYYDKFLKRLLFETGRDRNAVKLIGLAFKEQFVDEKDMVLDDHDVILDQIITGDD